MGTENDYYRVLGVLDDAEDIVIRAAYRALAQRYHPDKWQGDPAEATRRMVEINAAYAVLSDTVKRAAYDATRDKTQFRDEPPKTSRYPSQFPEMVNLPKGQFVMGPPQDEVGRSQHVVPQHMVRIGYEFAVGKYPVTFDQWDACVKDGGTEYSPPDFGRGRGNHPVINVSWDDTQLYLRWLSKVTGKTYRLLSEAEWEYAARAGSQTDYSFGDNEKELGRYAWFRDNSGGKPHPVGEKLPNAFGLHDMHGNVEEWTQDCWNANYNGAPTDGSAWSTGDCYRRVVRGGSWYDHPQALRSAGRRIRDFAAAQCLSIGFRVARTN